MITNSDPLFPVVTKICRDCGLEKSLDDFPRNKRSKDGRHTYCKPCHNARGKETKGRLFGGSRHYHLRRRYGIGSAQVDAMIQAQRGICAICRSEPTAHVDHDHGTGLVRGILCFDCNGGIGQFKDNAEYLSRAIEYLISAQLVAVA